MTATGSTAQDRPARAVSAKEAAASIHPGDHVFVGAACATPRALVDALEQLAQATRGRRAYALDRVGPVQR